MEVQDLYTKFYQELLAYCKAMTKSKSAAEDLVQETFLKAFTHWDSVEDLSTNQRRAWLYKAARNLYIDQIRKQARETPTEEDTLALASFEEDLSQAAVAQLIARLPDAERALFIMRYFEGYNSKELGELFALPSATVRSRLASAKRRLREWITND
ncbi:MAG: RNA polymerase sigma factor [Oscillospiraceae bacterium]|nr:RNA polymerase sigma factor [Oscillospiraceae bacterium]